MSGIPKDQQANLSRGPCEHSLVEDLYVSGKLVLETNTYKCYAVARLRRTFSLPVKRRSIGVDRFFVFLPTQRSLLCILPTC